MQEQDSHYSLGGLAETPDFLTADPQLRAQAAELARAGSRRHYCIHGAGGSGHGTFARWVWKQGGEGQRPFIVADCARLRGLRDIQRHVVQAAKGDLYFEHLESLPESLWAVLAYFQRAEPSLRMLGSWEQASRTQQHPQLSKLFPVFIELVPLKQRLNEIPWIVRQLSEPFGLEELGVEELAYIVDHTLSLRYSQFVFLLERIAERSAAKGGSTISLALIQQLVNSSKKMLTYEQLITHRSFARILSRAKFGGIREALQIVEAAIIAQVLKETFHCYAHTARILQLPISTLSSRQRVLAAHLEVFKRVL